MKEQLIINIRMNIAALRQYLRDWSDEMTEEEKNVVLDQILKLTELLKELDN